MEIRIDDKDKTKASLFLITDMLENILSYASDPGQCGEYITSQVRELVGAKIVALVQAAIDPALKNYSVVSVCPQRHKDTILRPEISKIYQMSETATKVIEISPAKNGNSAAKKLKVLNFNESFVIPLKAGGEHVGALLLLDLLSKDGAGTIIEAIQSLSDVIGLVLKNTMFYQKLDQSVKERTIELEQEINERKRAEKALSESEKLFRSTFENAAIGMCLTSIDGYLKMVNPALCKILGYPEESLISKKFADLTHPDDIELSFKKIKLLLDGKATNMLFEKRYIHNSGNIVWTFVGTFLVRNGEGKPQYFVTHIEDITARKQAEEAKNRLETQLRQAAKIEAVGTLAGGIAHDFNNILGIIIGNTELAMDDVPDWNPARTNLEEIKKASMRARDVVRQLLSFSRKSEQQKRTIQIHTIIKESIQLLRASIPSSVEFRSNIPTDLGTILADPTQIHQVIINLCTNAAHAMEENGGTLELNLAEVELDDDATAKYLKINPGRYIQLAVSDTGCGIDPEIKDRIFDPYFTTKEVDKGTGIGLAVVHGIVKNHGGGISVYSEPTKGTTIRVLFPVIDEKPALEKITSEELPKGNENVLLIDDEEAMVKMGQQVLERLGYQVEASTNPVEALEQFRSNPNRFDLVITDMTMPQMNGDRLVKEILKIQPDMPIILCTGYSEKITRESAGEIGIRKYIEKPLIKRELSIVIREVLDEK